MLVLPDCVKRIITYTLIWFNFFKFSLFLMIYYLFSFVKSTSKIRFNPPKCLTDVQYGSHGYLSVKGVKIHYVEAGDKSKPLLLFVHGFPEFWFSWRYQLTEFSKDYWCVAIDLRGYGYSDKPDGLENYRSRVIVDEIKDFVKLLGRERFTIVGHDWGSIISSVFVDRYGDMLDGYILMCAPSPDVYYKLLWSEYKQFRNSWYIFLFSAPLIPEFCLKMNDLELFDKGMGKNSPKYVSPDDIEAYKYIFSKPGALKHPLMYYKQEVKNPSFPEIQTPINKDLKGLLILGEKDPFISPGCVPLMKEKYKGLQVEVMKNAFHFIQQENPIEVNQLMRTFLKKL